MKKVLLFSVLVLVLTLAACRSSSNAKETAVSEGVVNIESAPPPRSSNIEVAPLRSTIIDWNNRNMGEAEFPGWLRTLIVNKQQVPVRNALTLSDNAVLRVGQAQRANREEARVLADLMFAQQIANELKRYVVVGAASRLDQGQMEIVEDVTTTTKVTITGGTRLADFWQLVETEDNGMRTREYIYYIVYTFRPDIWTQIVAKYIQDVIGNIPDSAVRQQINSAQEEIARQFQRVEERSDAEFRHELDMQLKQVENLQEQEMAKIRQQTAQTAVVGDVARAQAVSEARARYAAYRSGDPLVAAAASITANDVDWVKALGTVASAIF